MPDPSGDLVALVPRVDLESLTFVELSARRELDGAGLVGGDIEPRYTLKAERSDDLQRFRLVLTIEISVAAGTIVASACAEHTVRGEPSEAPSQRLVVESANEVGIMAMIPYLRQAIADLTQRVFGSVLLMPVLARGAIAFPLPDV